MRQDIIFDMTAQKNFGINLLAYLILLFSKSSQEDWMHRLI